jgi:hypothetical protein
MKEREVAKPNGADAGTADAKLRALNGRQEEFCQAYVLTGNGAKAADRAGYARRAVRQQASRLLTNANILGRIAELRRDLGLKNEIDRDTVMAKLEAAYRGAMTGHMYLTAVRAAEAQGRLAGLFAEHASASKSEQSPANGEIKKQNGAFPANEGAANKTAASESPETGPAVLEPDAPGR